MMLYCFAPANDRHVVLVSHNYHIHPEVHPSRIMEEHDIFYVIDGYCSVRLEEEELLLNPGEIAVLPARHPHYKNHFYRANTHTIFVHFSIHEGDHAVQEGDPLPENAILVQSTIHTRSQVMYQYFHDLDRTYWSDVPHRDLRCSAILGLILMEMHDCYKNKGIKRDQLMGELLIFLADHPHRFYTIPELASQASLGPKSLTSRFKAETGQTIHQYQMNKKLNQIAVLLRNESGTTLKGLADNFGFYDEFHLSASFKRKFGISPNQFSRNLNYTFDPSITGFLKQFDHNLKPNSIVHIADDNITLIGVKKMGGTGSRILVRLRESMGRECQAHLWITFTASAAYLTDDTGSGRFKGCTLSEDGRELSFPISAWDVIHIVLELPETSALPAYQQFSDGQKRNGNP